MEYTFHEMPDMAGTGKRKVYPKPFHCTRVENDLVMKEVASRTAYAAGAIEALIGTLAESLDSFFEPRTLGEGRWTRHFRDSPWHGRRQGSGGSEGGGGTV